MNEIGDSRLNFPQIDLRLSGHESSDSANRHNGLAARLGEHGIELRPAEMQGSSVVGPLEVGLPDSERGLLQLAPRELTEARRTGEVHDVGTCSGDVCNVAGGEGAVFHAATRDVMPACAATRTGVS